MKEKRLYAIIPIALVIILVGVSCIYFVNYNKNKGEKETHYLSASWSYNYSDIEEISQASDIIAIVRVSNQAQSYEEGGLPYTETKVEVIDPIYGVDLGNTLNIYQTGGETDDSIIEVEDDPLLHNKEEFLIFAQQNEDGTITILSGPQGRLKHSNGVLNTLKAENSRARTTNTDMNINVVNASIDDMTQQIQNSLRNAKKLNHKK